MTNTGSGDVSVIKKRSYSCLIWENKKLSFSVIQSVVCTLIIIMKKKKRHLRMSCDSRKA